VSRIVRIGGVFGTGLAARSAVRRAREIDLSGRVALVTGGSRGLGFALAQKLALQGARVAICARGEEQLERARKRLAAGGADVLAIPCDVADRTRVDHLVAATTERFGRIDVLINNAGVIAVGPLATQTLEDFEEMLAIQLWGVVNCTLAVLPQMLARREGRIANVTSIGGKISVPWLLPYNTAKYAALGFSEGLRAELAGTGVRVTTVVPGLMRTGSYLAAYFKGERAELEYALFTPLAATPLTTVAAGRAARRIVTALRRGEPEITLGLHAKLAARANGLAPGLVADVLGVVARALPDNSGTGRIRGSEIASPVDDSPLTTLGRKAARELNQ
jgi:NAD(P)-dependent dehydrogenase (short-subunit alcohol dehydrogenase family)